jgi:hypothetical protein
MRIIRHTALAVTALIASVALTACQGDADATSKATGSDAANTAISSVASGAKPDTAAAAGKGDPAKSTKTTGPTDKQASDTSGSDDSSVSKTSSGSGGSGSSTPGACTASSLKMTASAVSRPINHVLLTATNVGGKTCYLYYAPAIAFSDDAQSPIQTDSDTQPQAVVTLSPGQSGYAMIRTAGESNGDTAYSTQKIRVNFQNRDNTGSTGSAAYARLGSSISVIDSQSAVTYWQSDVSAVSAW